MSFAADVIGVLPFLRTQAESLMIDSCRVDRPVGSVTDPETGDVTASTYEVYAGKCKIQQTVSQASNPTAGGHQFTVQDVRWDIPVSAARPQVDDVVTITESAFDAMLVDRVFRVVETFHKSYATAQRTRVEEITQ